MIHKCFLSRDPRVLSKACVTYVRPTLEYVSVMWSPYHINEISKVESVQRGFTKRIAGLRNLSYSDRLNVLQLKSLEIRRLRIDLLYTYKILFGLNQVDWTSMFQLSPVNFTRGHCYKLYAKTSRVNVRHNFFCYRVVSAWNCLPARAEHFCSYSSFKSFLFHVDIATLL